MEPLLKLRWLCGGLSTGGSKVNVVKLKALFSKFQMLTSVDMTYSELKALDVTLKNFDFVCRKLMEMIY